MEQSILDGLNEYRTSGSYPWHMPGHKRRLNTIFPEMVENPFDIDVTEVGSLDEFHSPEGIIKKAFERAAEIYGSHKSYYLINGSSCGLLAAISAVCKRGDSILVARNSHKSVYNALRLLQLKPIYIMPEWNKELDMFGGVSVDAVKKAIKHHPEIKAILIVSPTYEGVVSDVEKIAKAAHKHRIPLIVDAAHGAHFEFMANVNETLSAINYKKVPDSAIRKGADIVIESLHKTLPAMTQCAILHENSQLVQQEKLEEFLSIYQSTSPSYVFMASIEACIEKMDHERDGLFILYKKCLSEYRKKFESLKHIYLVGEEDFKWVSGVAYDDGKLVFSVKNCGIQTEDGIKELTGMELSRILEEEYGQMLEMAGGSYVIAMTSVADTQDSFEALYQALEAIDGQLTNYDEITDNILYNHLPTSFMDASRAREMPGQMIMMEDASGRVSHDYIFVYPPGIPILTPGEVFTGEIIGEIRQAIDNNMNVKGVQIDDKGNYKVSVTATANSNSDKKKRLGKINKLWHIKDGK